MTRSVDAGFGGKPTSKATSTSFADLVKRESVDTPGRSGLCTMLMRATSQLSLDDLADLHAALDNPSVSSHAIVRALLAVGVKSSPTSVKNHRSGMCPCQRTE